MPMPTPTTTTTTTAADAAPVLEFRCLFSRDGHKKRKTFHDGTLKFHAFNARVMVYDLDRHYVGDLHYRHDDDFDEGLELRLDSGVVVQVQDRLGQTLTPLDQVLGCKSNKAAPAAGNTTTAARQPRRPIPAVSQQRPRSLKDVLAASQRAPCRPRAPVLPPDWQRPPPDQPPRKKLKPTVTTTAKDTATALPFQDVVDLSSDDEPPPPQPQPQPQPSKLPKQTPPRPRPQPRAKSPLPCPKVRLCLPRQKPRPKLMYRALLAPSKQSPPHSPLHRRHSPAEQPSLPDSLNSRSVPGVQTAFSRKPPLRRVASEADASFAHPARAPPTLIKTTSASALVPSRESPAQERSGPWTSEEAFLLFDWWPAGKKKADYGSRT